MHRSRKFAAVKYMRLSVFVLIVGFILGGCATNPTIAPSHNGSAAKVAYKVTGYASFYGHGDGFNGREMANGDRFNAKNPHLAAHPYLPLGTKLRVTDLRNNKVLYVEVTDRMGKVHGRIIDLSYGACKYFGMRKSGLAKVRVKSISDDEYRLHVAT